VDNILTYSGSSPSGVCKGLEILAKK